MASLLLSIVSIISFINLSSQQDDSGTVTCYSWTGQEFTNNTICAGSNVCCASEDLCSPNRFCIANNQTIVPACSSFPWNDCANICQYDPDTGFLPRAVQCDDGSYCCDNDPQCCANNDGIVLNGLGAVVSTDGGLAALSTTKSPSTRASSIFSTTSTSKSVTSSHETPTATGSAAETPSTNATRSSTLSAGAIAGIAIAIAALVAGLGTFLFWVGRRRGKKQRLDAQNRSTATQFAAAAFEEQREKHVSRQMLHGTPVYSPLRKTSAMYNDVAELPSLPQEMSAGTPYMK